MSNAKSPASGTDWTGLLTDPDLIEHLSELLQIYREAAPEKREGELLAALRQIKSRSNTRTAAAGMPGSTASLPHPMPVTRDDTPPFEPDIFTPSWGQDRRRYPRIRCFVAVELKVGGSEIPVWGNLSNTSMGGCYIETVSPIKSGSDVQIGLWVANGKVWVKGMILNGIVIKSNPAFGVRVRFDLEPTRRESLRQFLKFVETTSRAEQSERSYLQKLRK